jgi:eukaryotic-like serine/threonine-protein kinase
MVTTSGTLRGTCPIRSDDPAWRREILHDFLSLAAAAAYLHSLDIVHRDIKPGNVLIMEDGELRLSDFGLVKSLMPGPNDAARPQTSTGAVLGTRRYMAPEQEHVEEVGKPSDVDSLGILLADLALGRWPEPDTHLTEGSSIRRCPLLARLPDPLRSLISRCTDVDTRKRPANAQAVHDEFTRLVESVDRMGLPPDRADPPTRP